MANKEVKDMSNRELLEELVSFTREFEKQSPAWFMGLQALLIMLTFLLVIVILFMI